MKVLWNGQKVEAYRGTAVVLDSGKFPAYWAKHLTGTRVHVVKLDFGKGADFIYDEEDEGWEKVIQGGDPEIYHASVEIEEGSFVSQQDYDYRTQLAQIIYDSQHPDRGSKWLTTVDGTPNVVSFCAADAVLEFMKKPS